MLFRSFHVGYGSGLRAQLLRGGLGSLIIQIVNMCVMVAITVVLARACGAEGYGAYAYIFAIVQLLIIPAQMGFQVLVVREVSSYCTNKQWHYLRGLLFRALSLVSLASGIVIISMGVVAALLKGSFTSVQLETLAWGLVLLPLIALGNLLGAFLRGLQKVVQGQISELLMRPGVFLSLILVTWLFLPDGMIAPEKVMFFHVLAGCVAFVMGVVLLLKHYPKQSWTVNPRYETSRWSKSAITISLISGMQVINSQTDVIMLGVLTDSRMVGIYKVSMQGALLVAFGLKVINIVVAPYFAKLFFTDDKVRLQKLVTISARISLMSALPLVVIFFMFGDWLLFTVFGQGFVVGHMVLCVSSLGQLANAAMGSVVVLLNMTGHEKSVAKGLVFSASLNIVLNFVLIPRWGIEGAAIATSITLIFWNLLLAKVVFEKIGITSWAFFAIRR